VTRQRSDVTTPDNGAGLQAGMVAYDDKAPVLVGWLATHTDGTVARLGLDRAKADYYAATHHATLEAMFVWRELTRSEARKQVA
jgi:hypothetical protein